MFTFKPAAKSSASGDGNGNGHTPNGNGNGHSATGNGNGSENGHSAPPATEQSIAGNGQANGNGHGHATAPRGQGIANWLGLGGNGNKVPRPAARKDNHNGHKVDSVIGPGIHFKGTLTGAGSLRIDGTFDGTINIQGPLLITDGAKVTAEVRAGAVSVGGSLKGNIYAAKVEILSTGRVWGDLVTTAFATEEGAFLRGQVRMEDEVLVAEPAPALKTEVSPAGI